MPTSNMNKKLKENHLLLFIKMIPDMVCEYWNFTRETVRCNLSSSKSKQFTEILMLTHAIEKGFSLKNVRGDFGVAKIKNLVNLLCKYVSKYGYDDNLRVPISLIFAYQKFRENQHNLTDELENLFAKVDGIVSQYNYCKSDFVYAGTKTIMRQEMLNLGTVKFSTLVHNRHSVRNFDNSIRTDTLEGKIKEAINIAKYSPSACNRQAYRVHVYKGDDKKKALTIQGGASQFCDDAEMAIIITGDMNRYYSFEQHLLFVDSSLFAMSLLYALTAQGCANIPLTLSIKRKTLYLIKKELDIPQNETPVIMIAVGHYAEQSKISLSERMKYTDFTTFHTK